MAVPNQFRKIVGGASLAAGGIGVPGAFSFGADVPALMGIWGTGAVMITKKAGISLSKKKAMGLATNGASGVVTFLSGSKVASMCFHMLPGPGTLAAIGVNSSLNAFFTYRFLRSVAKVCDTYDSEEITHQVLMNGIALLSLTTILSDFGDMKSCMADGFGMKGEF